MLKTVQSSAADGVYLSERRDCARALEGDLGDGLFDARATWGPITRKTLGTSFETGLAGSNAWLHRLGARETCNYSVNHTTCNNHHMQ